MSIEAVLVDWLETAAQLERTDNRHDARLIRTLVDDVQTGAAPLLHWVDEESAVELSGHARRWLRSRYAAWEAEGNARRDRDGSRWYRAVVLPRCEPLDKAA